MRPFFVPWLSDSISSDGLLIHLPIVWVAIDDGPDLWFMLALHKMGTETAVRWGNGRRRDAGVEIWRFDSVRFAVGGAMARPGVNAIDRASGAMVDNMTAGRGSLPSRWWLFGGCGQQDRGRRVWSGGGEELSAAMRLKRSAFLSQRTAGCGPYRLTFSSLPLRGTAAYPAAMKPSLSPPTPDRPAWRTTSAFNEELVAINSVGRFGHPFHASHLPPK